MNIGTRFLREHCAPWSGPCEACGHRRPTHYVVEQGRRRRVTCATHGLQRGVERATLVCEVTASSPSLLSYRVVETLNARDIMPGARGATALVVDGGYNVEYFARCVADGTVLLLQE